jgi:sulfur relay (sulfurtransferase) complex TusBCD TusD component (DsrE family)
MEVAKNILIIINNGPSGDERPFNALRLGVNLVKRPEVKVRVYLTGEGVQCAAENQKTPEGNYNIKGMMKSVAKRGEVAT